MAAVEFTDVSKAFRVGRSRYIKDAVLGSKRHRSRSTTVKAVEQVSFSIGEGESVALLGHNGSGKSTCLRLTAGVIAPTTGTVSTHGRLAPLLELGTGFHPDLTGRENIYLNAAILGVPRSVIIKQLDGIIDFAGIEEHIDTPVRFYSTGMFVRLGFAIAINVDPDIILVDEVLAVGDAGFQEKCLSRMTQMKSEGRTVILVTHSFPQAQDFCDRAIVLSHGQTVFDGPIDDAQESFYASTHRLDG